MELHGMIMLHISDEKFARIRLHVENEDKRGVQLQVKPVCVRASNMHLLCSCPSPLSKRTETGVVAAAQCKASSRSRD